MLSILYNHGLSYVSKNMNEKYPNDPGFRLEITGCNQPAEVGIDIIGDGPQIPEQPPAYDDLYPHASQALADHIADVRKNGDAFDRRKSLHWRFVTAQLAVPAVVAAELNAAGGTWPPAVLATGLGGAVTAIWHNIRQDKKVLCAAQDEYLYGNRGETGQYYELYREAKIGDKSKDADIALVWYQPHKYAAKKFGVVENLRQIAHMAKEQGVKTMCVDSGQIANINRHGYRLDGLRGTTALFADTLVKEMKGLKIAQEKMAFVVETPQFWLEFAENLRPDNVHEKQEQTFAAVVDMLERLKPNHPMLGPVKMYGHLDTEEARKSFKAAIDKIVNPTLFRQEQYPERGKELKNQGVPFTPRHITDTEAGHVSDDAEDIIWQTRRNGFKKQDIYRYYGLTKGRYDQLLDASESSDPELKIENLVSACEIAIIKASRGKFAEITVEDNAQEEVLILPSHSPSLQQELMNSGVVGGIFEDAANGKINTLPTRRRQLLAAAGAFVALNIAGDIVHDVINTKEEYAISVAKTQLANERRVDPQFVTKEDAQKYLDQNSWKWNAWHTYSEYEDFINKDWSDIFPDSDGEGTNPDMPASFSTGVSGIGNANLPDRPDFTVISHGGAKADGFWAVNTATNLHLVPASKVQLFQALWKQDLSLYRNAEINHQFPERLPQEYRNGPSLEVKRELISTDQPKSNDQPYPVSLPVLEGTRPVAGNINGQEVELYKKDDNTYGIVRADDSDPAGSLRYWLVPDKDAPVPKAADQLKITAPLNAPEVSVLMGPKTEGLLDGGYTKEAFSKAGELHEAARMKSDEIKNTWEYSFTPFSEEQESSWKSFDDLVADSEKSKLANCNVANTVAGLQDPTSAQVMGYMNHPGSGTNVLSANEAHQKRTDGDATPLVPAAPLPLETPFELPFSPLYIALAGAGVIAILQRKNMKQLAFKTAKRYDDKSRGERLAALTDVPTDDIVRAHAAAEVLHYAPRLTSLALNVSAERLYQRSHGQALAALAASQLTSQDTAEALEARSYELQYDLPDLAARLARSSEVIRQVSQVERDKAGQPGVAVSRLGQAFDVTGRLFSVLGAALGVEKLRKLRTASK